MYQFTETNLFKLINRILALISYAGNINFHIKYIASNNISGANVFNTKLIIKLKNILKINNVIKIDDEFGDIINLQFIYY